MKQFEDRIDPKTDQRYRLVRSSGAGLKANPLLNKGTSFSQDERETFALEGLLPPAISTWAEQQERVYEGYLRQTDPLAKYLELTSLQDRNETLFYRLLIDHIEEMAPIVYTPTVGKACQQFSHLYQRPRGLYINLHQRGRIEQILRNATIDDCRVMVVTDNEAILGLGDLGVGGMGIPIGKLTLYTAGAGIHPAHCLPVDLDVGTNNTDLLRDPLYLGIREPRARGDEYYSFIDEFADAVKKVFPRALVQWEDFSNETAFTILERYRDKLPSFDDDIQGTGAVIAAGVLAAVKRTPRPLGDERIVILGAGAAGGGCAFALRVAMEAEGVPADHAKRQVLCLDSRGLILSGRPGLRGHKAEQATDAKLVSDWKGGLDGVFELAAVVENFKPTVLIGTSGQPGTFTEPLIRKMASHCEQPIVMPLSNPTSMAEATPEHLMRWTNGKAIIGTGSPFDPVTHNGVSYGIGQANNVLIFPGAGLGAIAVGATAVPDSAFLAAAQALVAFSDPSPTAPLFPPLSALREVSHVVARAVGRAIVEAGAAPECSPEEIDRKIAEAIWDPAYLPYRNR